MKMISKMQNLCSAIIIFLGFGNSSFPCYDREKIIDIFGRELLDQVLLILSESGDIEVNWSNNLTLAEAGALVRCEMQRRHPDLDDAALDAIVWKYTYDWQ